VNFFVVKISKKHCKMEKLPSDKDVIAIDGSSHEGGGQVFYIHRKCCKLNLSLSDRLSLA
jgi:hypothetical protein